MSQPIRSKLQAVRRRHAILVATAAVVGAVGLAALCLAGGMLLDRYLELGDRVRTALLATYGVVVSASLLRYAVWPVLRGPDVEQAALWVERDRPIFSSRLISTVQLTAGGESPRGMVAELVRQTEAIAETVDFKQVVKADRVKRIAVLVVLVIGAIVGGCLFDKRASAALLQRALLLPVPFPRRTQIVSSSGNVVIARGDSVTLTAECAGDIPPAGWVHVKFADGTVTDWPMTPPAGRPTIFDRRVENVTESFSYTVYLGDNQTADMTVTAAERPAVVSLDCTQVYPSYTGLGEVKRSAWDLSLLQGSQLGLSVKVNKPMRASADVYGNHLHFVGSEISVPLVADINDLSRLHPVEKSLSIPPGTTGFTIELLDEQGLRSKESVVYRIDWKKDQPPTVRLTEPEPAEQTVTTAAKPAVAVTADDDFGVKSVALRYRVHRSGATVEDDPNGLTATFFDNLDLGGAGIARLEPTSLIDGVTRTRPAGIGQNYSVRYVGQVRAATSDQYWFKCGEGDGIRMWVDGRLIMDRWNGQAAGMSGGPVPLSAGRLVPVKIEMRQKAGGAIRMDWWGTKQGDEMVPHEVWFHREGPLPVPAAEVDALVGYWTFEDDLSGFVRDWAGGNTGTVYNAKRCEGRIGRGIAFAAPDQVVVVPSTPAIKFHTADSFTLSVWASVDRLTHQWQGIVTKSRDGGNFYGLYVDPTGHFASFSPGQILVGPAATPGWHLVTLVQDGPLKRRSIYVDGVAGGSGTAAEADGWGDLIFGGVRGDQNPLSGSIDEVRVYGRALAVEQIRQMFTDPKPAVVPTPAEVAGISGEVSETVPMAAPAGRTVSAGMVWDLGRLATPLKVGDTVEFWAEAKDGNDVTGPGVGVSARHTFKVVSDADKRTELSDKLGDYLGQIRDVAESQKDLNAKVGSMVDQKPH